MGGAGKRTARAIKHSMDNEKDSPLAPDPEQLVSSAALT
jgi:hypothetical protein